MSDSTHPHFDDGGAVRWHADLTEALREATREQRLVLIEYGREQCTQCKDLVLNVIPREEIKTLLDERFVCVAADCDAGHDDVEEIAAKLDGAEMLPFVMVTDARGQYLDGLSGRIAPDLLHRLLERLSEAASA